ncbi:MAG: LamG domain-containing protein, partial [Candidatus Marinimicrobia bacterium]|nr:LamG domain-containing protein [Candidatus Neomarinimicrobiota bacterium]
NVMDITLSGEEAGLTAYWKFDEMEGETISDLSSANSDGATCSVERDSYIAPVYLGALANEEGNYTIKGIFYGEGIAFTVTPSMASPVGRSLKFDGVDDYIRFNKQRINLMDEYTLEGWFKTPSGSQMSLISVVNPLDDSHQLSIKLNNGLLTASHLGTNISPQLSLNDNLWHHYALTSDKANLTLYIDGVSSGTEALTGLIPVLSEMSIACKSPDQSIELYQGYLDEIRFWNTFRTADQVGGTMNQVLEGDNYGLVNYWRMNDGSGNLFTDASGLLSGVFMGADSLAFDKIWSQDIPLNEYFDHWYEPESRMAALNSGNTAVNTVDFTDQSLIPVSGYVRYMNTACFQEKVEILLNGASLIPPIWTDSDGKFIIDLEPGSAGNIISCSFKTPGTGIGESSEQFHEFIPPLMELPLITQPIAGLYFEDKMTHRVSGYVAGGDCKFPITPSQGQIEVTFTSVNGCTEVVVVPNETTGRYETPDLPPLIYNVSVNHPDPAIDEYFTADKLSLVMNDRIRDFIYHSLPSVEFTELPVSEYESDEYPLILKQRELYQAGFDVYEAYGENRCMIKKFNMQVFDNISDTSYSIDLEGEGVPHIQFTGNKVNLLNGGSHPYQNNLQIVITDTLNRTATTELWALIEGD